VAFLADEKPNLKYATAPFPVADDQPGQYGAGFVSGNILGIPKGAKHPQQAWLLTKFLATDTDAQVGLSNDLRNVPTTTAALSSPAIKPDPHFKLFLDIFGNPRSAAVPPTPVGAALQNNFQDMLVKYQAGNVADLPAALRAVDKANDAQLAQEVGAP
jgi:multiple sugar transport system substrate-binding protein